MNSITLTHTTPRATPTAIPSEGLMAMTNSQLEAWFGAGGLTVEVVANCVDPDCVDCVTLERAQEAA